jgi:voltage-gated potassium channel
MSDSLRRILLGAAVIFVTVAAAVIGYWFAGWDVLDAFYMVIITIFGVGYGEVHPINTPGMKIFTIGVILVGTSAGLYVIGGFIQMITEGEIQRALGVRRMTREIEKLKNHIIMCGFGRIGQILASELHEAKAPFVVIDTSPERIASAQEKGYLAMLGNATEESCLLLANIHTASTLATVLPDDAANVFITLSARNLNPKLVIIARGEQVSTEPKLKQAGANQVVMPASIGAHRMANLIVRPTTVDFLKNSIHNNIFNEELHQIGMHMHEILIAEGTSLDGKTVRDAEIQGQGAFLIVALRQTNGNILANPNPKNILKANDTLIVLGHSADIPTFINRHATKHKITYRGVRT